MRSAAGRDEGILPQIGHVFPGDLEGGGLVVGEGLDHHVAVVHDAAGIMLLALVAPVSGFRFLATLETSDRLAIWIVMVVLGVIGYLHNTNVWVADGMVNRPSDVALWKAELILGISLAAPAAHWLTGLLLPNLFFMNGKRFATEFALYVNFSGIALVLWTGDAALSVSTLGSALALMVLAELTLYASG